MTRFRRVTSGASGLKAPDPAGAAASSLTLASAVVRSTVRGDDVAVTVSLTDPTDVPLIGGLLPDVTVSATATMVLEPP